MASYKVTWEIDIGDADSYRDAAITAREIQLLNPESFSIYEVHKLSSGKKVVIDVMDESDDPQDSALEQLAEEGI